MTFIPEREREKKVILANRKTSKRSVYLQSNLHPRAIHRRGGIRFTRHGEKIVGEKMDHRTILFFFVRHLSGLPWLPACLNLPACPSTPRQVLLYTCMRLPGVCLPPVCLLSASPTTPIHVCF